MLFLSPMSLLLWKERCSLSPPFLYFFIATLFFSSVIYFYVTKSIWKDDFTKDN